MVILSCLSMWTAYLSMCLPICLPVCLSVCLSACLSVCLHNNLMPREMKLQRFGSLSLHVGNANSYSFQNERSNNMPQSFRYIQTNKCMQVHTHANFGFFNVYFECLEALILALKFPRVCIYKYCNLKS